MAALVDYTALTDGSWVFGFPTPAETPVSGIKKDFWMKVSLDFTKTKLTSADWAKVLDIPEKCFILGCVAVVTDAAGDQQLCVGDVNADHTLGWIPDIDNDTINTCWPTTPASTYGALGGKYYPSGGALYISALHASDLSATGIDLYVHGIMLG
jgi:hypothetical protein